MNVIRQEIIDYISSKGARIIGTVPRHTTGTDTHLYLIIKDKDTIKRKTWLMPPMKEKTHIIASTYETKTFTKHLTKPRDTKRVTEWVPGINLITYKMYQGTYPLHGTIKQEIERLSHMKHADWQLNNIIVQGKKCTMIDVEDSENPGHPYEPSVRKQYLKFVDMKNQQQTENYFWKVLVPAVQACKIDTPKKSRHQSPRKPHPVNKK
jgi:hypothetical protein